jgi:hypothetical protein
MKRFIRSFLRKGDAAVSVDWVVLTAAVLGLAMVVLEPVAYSTTSSTVGVANYIRDVDVGYDGN